MKNNTSEIATFIIPIYAKTKKEIASFFTKCIEGTI